jgi:hypothetical protein
VQSGRVLLSIAVGAKLDVVITELGAALHTIVEWCFDHPNRHRIEREPEPVSTTPELQATDPLRNQNRDKHHD